MRGRSAETGDGKDKSDRIISEHENFYYQFDD